MAKKATKKSKTPAPPPVDTRYEGWKNYETWNVKLWMDNDAGSQNMWNERADYWAAQASTSPYWSKYESAQFNLADEIKEYFEDKNPLSNQSSTYSDLLSGALSEVSWSEIAENLLEGKIEKKAKGGVISEYGGNHLITGDHKL